MTKTAESSNLSPLQPVAAENGAEPHQSEHSEKARLDPPFIRNALRPDLIRSLTSDGRYDIISRNTAFLPQCEGACRVFRGIYAFFDSGITGFAPDKCVYLLLFKTCFAAKMSCDKGCCEALIVVAQQ